MGPKLSRRMRKQGPPAPLEEFLDTKKRKASDIDEERGKKPRVARDTSAHRSAKRDTVKQNGASKAGKQEHKLKGILKKSSQYNGSEANGDGSKQKKIQNEEIEDEDEELDGLEDDEMDGIDNVKVTSLDALGSASEEEGEDEIDLDDDSVVDSEDDEDQRQAMWSEDEDDDGAGLEKLSAANIEGLSKRLDQQIAEDEADAEAELLDSTMQTNILGDRPKILDAGLNDDEGELSANLAPDLRLLRERINETIRVLQDFSQLGEAGRSRSEYTQQLLKDICQYYGYSSFLAEKLYDLFDPREAFAFFEANETPRPIVLRTNTLRTNRRALIDALTNRGVTTKETVSWSKVGLQIFESQVPLGATPEYMAGHYMLQTASSFLPVMALAPQENERVLDMAAAPGGKTTHMAALMRNTGIIFANDASRQRTKGLIGNIHRLGVKNTIVCNYNATEFPKVMGGFDRVLLDAPCTGTGVIAKDPSVKTNKTEADFRLIPELQKKLILAAIDSVNHASKTGGYVVYSTCSVTLEENEMVVEYALRKRPNVKLVDTGLKLGKDGFTRHMGKIFHNDMKLAKRYYPHTLNLDGFFVAKFKKTGPTKVVSNGKTETINGQTVDSNQEYVDKTPILDDEAKDDDFGGWDESEDEKIIEKSKKASARRKGIDPRTVRMKHK